MLEVNKINVFYGDLQVLWDISFKVAKGEIVALVGPNGSGKTTLCKTIIGALTPKNGSISFLGRRIDGLTPSEIVRMGIAIVPEGRRLFGHMSVKENLELGAYIKEARRKVKDTLEWIFNLFPILRERKNQLASSLSGGEQQMLAIARALMSRPKFLILDEPSLGLAPKMVLKIYDLIKNIYAEGMTILLVEQYVMKALGISNRAIVLENGRIILEGPSEELLRSKEIKKAYLGEE